jgi:antitoxin PrlF
MSTVVTQKGQATIPKPIRDLLRIGPGSRVEFLPTGDGGVRLVNCEVKNGAKSSSRFAALRGSATVRMSTEQIMALTRGDR